MKAHLQYLKYVLRHKFYVFVECLKLGVPIWIALLHDWDKFLPDEWFPYVHCFYAPDGSKQYKESTAFTRAWMHHQHRNKHHWQYWLNADVTPLYRTNILVWDRGTASIVIDYGVYDWRGEISVREEMPDVYRREMLADWRGAGRALGFSDTLAWYKKNFSNIKMGRLTRSWIECNLMSAQEYADWIMEHPIE